MKEEWKVYKVYKKNNLEVHKGDKLYFSNLGRCKINDIIIEPYLHFNYLMGKGIWIHRAVAELFIQNTDNKRCVDHINGNKLDNRACNLRWCTHSENNNYRYELNPYKRSEQGNANIIEGCKKRGNKWHENILKSWTEERKKNASKILKGRKGPNINKHREWLDEEHTKYHYVYNN